MINEITKTRLEEGKLFASETSKTLLFSYFQFKGSKINI